MGLQERKQKTKMRILESAEFLFRTQGFAKTTMNDVASRSELGVGTLYNYYPSKSELLIAIFREKIEDVALDQLIDPARFITVVDQIKAMSDFFVRRFVQHDRALLRESIALAIGIDGEATAIAKGTVHLDAQLMRTMQDVIERGKQSGQLESSFDAAIAVQLIHASAVALVLNYLMDEQMTVDDVMVQLHRRIAFLLRKG